MSLTHEITALRNAAKSIAGFRSSYISDDDTVDALFEFASMMGVVSRLSTAQKVPASVVVQGYGRFARKPGDRLNFNYVEVGLFEVYLGVNFVGRSGATHAPDIVVCVRSKSAAGLVPVLIVECKCYSNSAVPRPITNAFAGVLVDLDRPRITNLSGEDVLHGTRFSDCEVLDFGTHGGSILSQLVQPGWSILATTCETVPVQHISIGEQYGFVIHVADDANGLV